MMPRKTHLDIPPPYGQLFESYDSFNELQAALLDDLLHTDKSVVLSAPTGSGKTVAFELAIVRMLQRRSACSHQGIPPKAIYIAPIKALCAEKFSDWKPRFEALNVNCLQITGDTEGGDLITLHSAELVVTTPEKWDSLTRRWRECCDIMSAVQLLMIDEVHLLNEDVRGPILEVVVSRMKTIVSHAVRFVVVSATIPNIEDLRLWISSGRASADVTQWNFDEMQRPVPLEKHILGFNSKLKGFRFDMSLNYKLPEIICKYSERKATLIFCNSRKSTEMAANLLAKNGGMFQLSSWQQNALNELSTRLNDSKLRSLVVHGIAFHHAGITFNDRAIIEDGFRSNIIMVLLSTNTLAMGLNLPAHLVIIKSTESYCHSMYVEYTESNILQMIGRAGRPQFDTKGVAVIMTHKRNVPKYKDLMYGQMPVESHLHKHLAEHLNAEIGLKTITNLEVAMNWIRTTFLYIRAVRVPEKYGLEGNRDKDIIERKLERLCLEQINALEAEEMVVRSDINDLDVQITELGKLMARYYISFETMKLFRQIRGTETILEMLNVIVRCNEFADHMLRVNEKKALNELNSSPLRFPIQGRIKTREEKISCLLQSILGNLNIESPGLLQEATKIMRIGERVSKCLLEYMRLCGNKLNVFNLGCYKALLHSVTIAKCFHAKLWENSEFASKQLRKIGAVYSSSLASAGKITLKSIAKTDARTIEQILNKSCPFGDEVLQNLLTFPEYMLQANLKATGMLYVFVKQINEGYKYDGSSSVLIVGDSANNLLLFDANLESHLREFGYFEKTIKIPNTAVERLMVHVIHNSLVGVDEHVELIINPPAKRNEAKLNPPKKTIKRKEPFFESLSMQLRKKQRMIPGVKELSKPEDTPTILSSKLLDKLDTFAFKKAKVNLSAITTKSEEALEESAAKRSPNEEKNKKLDEAELTDKRCANQTHSTTMMNSSNELIQTKLTEYFASKKNLRADIIETPKFFSMSPRDGSKQLRSSFEVPEKDSNENEDSLKQPQAEGDETLVDEVHKLLNSTRRVDVNSLYPNLSLNDVFQEKFQLQRQSIIGNSVNNSLLMHTTEIETDDQVELSTIAVETDTEVGVSKLNKSWNSNTKASSLQSFLRAPTKSGVRNENLNELQSSFSMNDSANESLSEKTKAYNSRGTQIGRQSMENCLKSVESSRSLNNKSFNESPNEHIKASSFNLIINPRNGVEFLNSHSTNSSVEILSEKSNDRSPRTANSKTSPIKIHSDVSFWNTTSMDTKETYHIVKPPNYSASNILNETLPNEIIAQSLIRNSQMPESNSKSRQYEFQRKIRSQKALNQNISTFPNQSNLSNTSIDNFTNAHFSGQIKTRSPGNSSSPLRVNSTNTNRTQCKCQSQQSLTKNVNENPSQEQTYQADATRSSHNDSFNVFPNRHISCSPFEQFVIPGSVQDSSTQSFRQQPEKQFSQTIKTQKSLIRSLDSNTKENEYEIELPLSFVRTETKESGNELEFCGGSGNKMQNHDESVICLNESSSKASKSELQSSIVWIQSSVEEIPQEVQSPIISIDCLSVQSSNEKLNEQFSQNIFQKQKSFDKNDNNLSFPENEFNDPILLVKNSSSECGNESTSFTFRNPSKNMSSIQSQTESAPIILDISADNLTHAETIRTSSPLRNLNLKADNRNDTIFEISTSDPEVNDGICNEKVTHNVTTATNCNGDKKSDGICSQLDFSELSSDLNKACQPWDFSFFEGDAKKAIDCEPPSIGFDLNFKPTDVAVHPQYNNRAVDVRLAPFCTSRKTRALDLNLTEAGRFNQCARFDVFSLNGITTPTTTLAPPRTVHFQEQHSIRWDIDSFVARRNSQNVAATKKEGIVSDNHISHSSSSSSTTAERTLMFWFNIAHTFANQNLTERNFSSFKKIYSNMAGSNLGAFKLTKAELWDNSVPEHCRPNTSRYRLKLFANPDLQGEATREPSHMPRADIRVDNINRRVMQYVLNNKCEQNNAEPSPDCPDLDLSSSNTSGEMERLRKLLYQ